MRRMMLDPIPPKLQQLWDKCDLRVLIILSLSLQSFLIFVAPLRKRSKSNWILVSLWCAYLSADWAANFAVGLILNSQRDPGESSSNKKGRSPVEYDDLLAFWAPFLLVHLGGPDTITALALEDNELWLRHLLGLVLQCVAVVYVFIMSLPHNGLWIPTVLIFLNGMIKYIERSRSLYLASLDKFKYSVIKEDDPNKNNAKLKAIYNWVRRAKLPAQIIEITKTAGVVKSPINANMQNLTDLDVVRFGYQFFKKYMGLYVDMIFNFKEWNESRDFFLKLSAENAFRVVEVELNFMYDVLFTKLPVVYGKFGAFCRIFSLVSVCLAIILFAFISKAKFWDPDVIITYALLIGALVLDTTALLMLLFSDWTIISFQLDGALNNSLKTKRTKSFDQPETSTPQVVKSQRWSETIPSYNLISYCLHPRPRLRGKIFDILGLTNYLDSIVYVKSNSFSPDLREFVFLELKSKALYANDLPRAKEVSSGRGDWVLKAEGWDNLLGYVSDVDFDQSIILWHMATEICYNSELYDEVPMLSNREYIKKREISKLLSDYMLYLLSMQPIMMFVVTGVRQIRFLDTCAKIRTQVIKIADKYEQGYEYEYVKSVSHNKRFDWEQINVCMGIRDELAELDSELFGCCSLANELMKMDDRWEIMSKVWVEMLCYAASHSRANMQVAQVSKGGELITIVWLLMTHLGLADRFQHKKRKKISKLFLGK